MNQSLLIWIVVGLIVVGGGGYILSMNGSESSEGGAQEAVQEEGEQDTSALENFTGSIRGLLGLGQNITCTFTHEEAGSRMEGVVYVTGRGEKVRSDFSVSSEGQQFEGSAIVKDGFSYSWGDTPFGSFAAKAPIIEDGESSPKDDSQAIDVDETMDYKCSQWNVDESKFELPGDVEFTDISAEIQKINEATLEMTGLQCEACDQIPDAAAQAQCRAALGC